MPKLILIFSSSFDKPTTASVITQLRARDYEVIDYEADRVASGETTFSVTLSRDYEIVYDGKTFEPQNIAAAWFRRPIFSDPITRTAASGSIDAERRASQQLVEDLIPANRWLNSPETLGRQEANHKLSQLLLAQDVGFQTPLTMVSNDWKTVATTLGPKIVFKSFWGQRRTASGNYVVYTTRFDNTGTGMPPAKGSPFPGIWQNDLPKKREWRITAVGDQTFDAAIYHEGDRTKDDWRLHSGATDLHWKHETFPANEKEKCLAYCRKAGLRMGMFDFIETPKGEMIFLECNPNGQFRWLEDTLALPISKAVADELVLITGN